MTQFSASNGKDKQPTNKRNEKLTSKENAKSALHQMKL
jgi:hypothetical protein